VVVQREEHLLKEILGFVALQALPPQEVPDVIAVRGDDVGELLAQQGGFVRGEPGASLHELREPLLALGLRRRGALAGVVRPSALVLLHRVASWMRGRVRRSSRPRTGYQILPTARSWFLKHRERLPAHRERLPMERESLPVSRESLPASREGLPVSREILPASREGLPASRETLPV
jgi:hypothetical protein